jgi:hypothetical protein
LQIRWCCVILISSHVTTSALTLPLHCRAPTAITYGVFETACSSTTHSLHGDSAQEQKGERLVRQPSITLPSRCGVVQLAGCRSLCQWVWVCWSMRCVRIRCCVDAVGNERELGTLDSDRDSSNQSETERESSREGERERERERGREREDDDILSQPFRRNWSSVLMREQQRQARFVLRSSGTMSVSAYPTSPSILEEPEEGPICAQLSEARVITGSRVISNTLTRFGNVLILRAGGVGVIKERVALAN